MGIKEIYKSKKNKKQILPLYLSTVSAGFPSPADDYIEKNLDLNEYLIKHPVSTFFLRVSGDSMIKAGIKSGDILVVDRSLKPINNNVVVAVVANEFTVKRLKIVKKKIYLAPENDGMNDIEIKESDDFQVWGVVTSVIHQL